MIILFPSEPFSPKEVDSSLKPEYEAAKLVGFKIFLFDHDEFVKNDKLITNLPINPEIEYNPIIIRSWMLKIEQYATLYGRLFGRGYTLVNTPREYENCHHFPSYYSDIKEHTAKSTWGPSWEREVIDIARKYMFLDGECDLLIKDYVKSAKGNPDLFILKKELNSDEFYERVERFVKERGNLFEKGIVLKQVIDLKKYEGQTNEWRIFFLNQEPISIGFNSEKLIGQSRPSLSSLVKFHELGKKIESNFFTMDIAEKEDGEWIVLEMGDGQVSGLAAQEEPIKFYNVMYNELNKIKV